MSREDCLFSKTHWHEAVQYQSSKLNEEVSALEDNRLLNTSVDDLCEYFIDKYKVNIPVIQREKIEVDQEEIQVDVSRDRTRLIRDRSRPCYLDGSKIEITVPFAGDAEVFNIRPTTYSLNPPSATVEDEMIRFHISGINLRAEEVRQEIDQTLNEIDRHLEQLRKDAEPFNVNLAALARNCIEKRREKILANKNLVASLGFNIKKRDNSPNTYVTSQVKRKIAPVLPKASSKPYEPEPVLAESDYEHILEVIQNMTHVMERSPTAFSNMDEESLRTHYLVQLNGHYEGNATGETFNYEGKTDILIRVKGKNIFIAECKFWGGSKLLAETLNQLLSYSSWRDTKVAIIIFNRNKDFTKVLNAINETTIKHPNFKRALNQRTESSFRYIFAHRDDVNRELTLTVMAFDIPK